MVSGQSNKQTVIGVRCQDIQTGLHGYQVDEFETLTKVGIAARLSIHLRGTDVVEYNKLKEVSPLLFGISKLEFPAITTLLQEVDFVSIIGTGDSKLINPKVPYFGDMYERLGEKAILDGLTEQEKASIELLQRLSEKPIRKNNIEKSMGLEPKLLDRILRIGKEGSYFNDIYRPEGNIILTPLYFGENPQFFAEAVQKYGEDIVGNTISSIRRMPGTPLKTILENATIGANEVGEDELELIKTLVSRGILQCPSIETTYSGKNYFIFTPPIGTPKIAVVEKEIYEKAMAVIACVRQGEHFGDWRVKYPVAIIKELLRAGWLRATTIAREQYKTLILKRICRLEPPDTKWQRTVLIDTPENRRALELAAEMLETGEIQTGRGLDTKTIEVIQSDLHYQESLRAYSDMRRRKQVPITQKEYQESTDALLEIICKAV